MDDPTVSVGWLVTIFIFFILGSGLTLALAPRPRTYVVYALPPVEAQDDSLGCLGALVGFLLLVAIVVILVGLQ